MTQEFIVSILDDENDGDFSTGDLSLREAIALANNTEGDDTITFDSDLNSGTIVLGNTPLSITDSVAITGLGAENLTIDGDDGGNGIFNIDSGEQEIDVVVEDVTIANGTQLSDSPSGLTDFGGAFFVSDNANLQIKNSVITGSSASLGGAIYNRGTTDIIDSTIENNTSTGDGATPRPSRTDAVIVNRNELNVSNSNIQDNNGSAIFNIGTLEVSDTSIANNTSTYAGGAIDNRDETIIVGSNISGNSAPNGSAIRNTDSLSNRYGNSLTINDTIIEGNTSTSSDNSVIFTDSGAAFISNSTITDHDGGSNVGIVVESGSLDLEDSTISNNRADQAQSGIIVNPNAIANISNSTIANNEARSNAGIENFGTVNLDNNTIANNTGGLGGGGIRNFGTANITSNIVANNGGSNLGDISGEGTINSGGNNLVGNANDVAGLQDSDLTDIDPNLGELQDNGGVTNTIALSEGSVAIDGGSNPNNLTTDQRGEGFDRTVGEGTDIGAFEVQDVDNSDDGDEDRDGDSDGTTELVVSTLDDENDGDFSDGDLSLREAISLANDAEGADNITFDSNLSGGTIALTETQPDPRGLGTVNQNLLITDSLTITGLGANNLTIDGVSGGNGIFTVDGNFEEPTIDVVLEELTITNGSIERFFVNGGGSGGAIRLSNNADFTLVNSIVSNSRASGAGGISGGFNDVEIIGSLITNNSGGDPGFLGGAVTSFGDLTMINSTITNNTTGVGLSSRGTLDISNSTITDGISANNESTTLTSSIVVNNNAEDDDSVSLLSQNIISGGNNLIGNTNNAAAFVDSDFVGTEDNPINPLLGTLEDNGGNTPTIALLDGSLAIDAGSNPNNLTADQRGVGFDRTVGEGTDIGAFEVQDVDNGGDGDGDGDSDSTTELVVSTLDDENDGDFSDGDLSLREAIALASVSEGADTITFDDSLSGGTISLDESLSRNLIIGDSVTINGLGQDNLTIAGGFIFQLPGFDAELTINDLNLTGATVDSFGDLTLTNSTISQSIPFGGSSDNSSIISRGTLNLYGSSIIDSSGGDDLGILIESGTANITNSTIANHEGVLGGSGVLILTDETVNISNSTIANNNNRFVGGVGNGSRGEVNITNSTIANNNGGLGNGGIQNFGTVTLTSTIVGDNLGAGIGDVAGNGEYISGGNNLIGNGDDADGFVNGVNGDLVGSNGDDRFNPNDESLIDPNLGNLQDNGGATPTIALLDGSLAIDAGSNPNNLTADQRGVGFDRTVGDGTDIGAFEVQDEDNSNPSLDDIFTGTNENDVFNGLGGNDSISGQDGNDTLNGANGEDIISGGEGNDIIAGGNGNDSVNGGSGDDIIQGSRGEDTLGGDAGNDSVNGGADRDTLIGGNGEDTLSGNGNSDILFGDAGNDILFGGGGQDTLIGGDGEDILSGNNGNDVFLLSQNSGRDAITDFTDGSDRVGLSEGLSFEDLIITGGESNSGVLILDSTNHDAVLAIVENVHVADINAHDFIDV